MVGLQIGVVTHPGGVHVGSGPLRFGRVICNFRTPIERVELSKFPFDIFLYNCFDISIYKFLFWLKLDWKSAFLDKPCLARGLGLVLSRFNWGASRPVATDRRGQPDPLRVPEGSPLGVCLLPSFAGFQGPLGPKLPLAPETLGKLVFVISTQVNSETPSRLHRAPSINSRDRANQLPSGSRVQKRLYRLV